MTMKLALSASVILFSAPAFAGPTQLELSAGVPAGVYTQTEVAAIAAAETPSEARRLMAFYAEGDSVPDLVPVTRSDYATYPISDEPVRSGGSDRN